ncbi:hypothetical protein DN553_24550, partial [Burkholderia multivorans]
AQSAYPHSDIVELSATVPIGRASLLLSAGFGPGMGGDGAFCNNYGQQSNGSAGANGQFIIFEFA